MRLVLASNNAKKLAELGALLAGLPLQLVAQGELGIPEAAEPHRSFVENALAKARAAAAASGGAAIADDSGLCVDALGGAPGVDSAHWAELPPDAPRPRGREGLRALQDAANNARLLQALRAHGAAAERRAHFVCTLVALRHADDPQPLVAVGRWAGEVLETPRGEGGFGYDPLLWIPALAASVAELGAEVKNRVSHRAQAMAALRVQLAEVWGLREGAAAG
jgi:XTP/dITP diphosphohydrolase